MAGTKGKKLGTRVIVVVGNKKTKTGTKVLLSSMLSSVAGFYGFKPVPAPASKPSKKGGTARLLRGSKGAKSIKVPAGKNRKGQYRFKSIPVPSGATLTQIKAFLGNATKNKPDFFVSADGRTYFISNKNPGT